MNRSQMDELIHNLDNLINKHKLIDKQIFLFGHCHATEVLIDCMLERGFKPVAILDNNVLKHGKDYRGIIIVKPEEIIRDDLKRCVVCIVARAYAAMVMQLRELGYTGEICKLLDYNSFAEYSLEDETIRRKRQRVENGIRILRTYSEKYRGKFKIFCPFSALGDVYLTMSYLPNFFRERRIEACVIFVIGTASAEVVKLFGEYDVVSLCQKDVDEMVQAVLYTNDTKSFIAHQDRPYVINLHKALYIKCIPLDVIYRCGVFGLSVETKPCIPTCLGTYPQLERIRKGKAVIFSPYAKSVTALDKKLWEQIVTYYKNKGFQCFTNVIGDEKALPYTEPISPRISEIQSLVEHAGVFVGIRSGLCDVIKYANCKKIALYPDYNYSDTKWKAIDMYSLDGWENIEVKEKFRWERA